jgi:hypothetical protein
VLENQLARCRLGDVFEQQNPRLGESASKIQQQHESQHQNLARVAKRRRKKSQFAGRREQDARWGVAGQRRHGGTGGRGDRRRPPVSGIPAPEWAEKMMAARVCRWAAVLAFSP